MTTTRVHPLGAGDRLGATHRISLESLFEQRIARNGGVASKEGRKADLLAVWRANRLVAPRRLDGCHNDMRNDKMTVKRHFRCHGTRVRVSDATRLSSTPIMYIMSSKAAAPVLRRRRPETPLDVCQASKRRAGTVPANGGCFTSRRT